MSSRSPRSPTRRVTMMSPRVPSSATTTPRDAFCRHFSMNASCSKSSMRPYDSHVPLRAVFFDVGDTLVEHWAPTEKLHELTREALREQFGERDWYERWIAAEVRPPGKGWGGFTTGSKVPVVDDEALEQQTLRWYEEWFRNAAFGVDDIGMDRLRSAMCVPLDLVSTPVPGAFTAVRWCKSKGLAVVLVTNTLSRGDEEAWNDWRRFGLADAVDAIVTSHSTGWQKPHRKIYERALELARVSAGEAVMVGDRLDADV